MTHTGNEEPRETSGLTVRLVVSYVRKLAGPDGVQEMLRRAGQTRPLAVLEDERQWYSYDAKIALFRAAAEVTGQPDIGLRVGSHVFESTVGPSVRLMLSMFGSPAALLRHIAHANGKFTQCADLSAIVLSPTSGVATYRLHDGYTPSRFDCDYTRGMLAQIPPMFGLPPALVEHGQCQVDGAPACVYSLHWRPRRRWWARRSGDQVVDAHVVHQRLQELQHAISDLVGRDDLDVDAVLAHVVERAAYAVAARAFVLVAQLAPGQAPAVHSQGLSPDRAADVADRLLGGLPPKPGDHVIAAPVRSAARDYGQLAALAAAPFLPAELELLHAYAALAAAALDALAARLETEERRRTAEILLGFAGAVGAARHPDEVVQVAADAVRTLTSADVACVLLAGADGRLRLARHVGLRPAEERALEASCLDPAALPDLTALLTVPHEAVLADATAVRRWLGDLLHDVDVRQVGLVGLRCADHLHGVALAGWRSGGVDDRVGERLLERLTGAGIQTTIGLDKTELLQKVEVQARTDPLTGLVNRRHFLEALTAQQDRVTTHGSAAGLLFLDLDGFKQVNDRLGHAAGDALLVEVARRIGSCLAPADLLARLGGDEFTVLAPGVLCARDLVALADRVLAAGEVRAEGDGPLLAVRPSIGAVLLRPGDTAVDLLRAADEAMYAAKAAGGGRTVVARRGLAALGTAADSGP